MLKHGKSFGISHAQPKDNSEALNDEILTFCLKSCSWSRSKAITSKSRLPASECSRTQGIRMNLSEDGNWWNLMFLRITRMIEIPQFPFQVVSSTSRGPHCVHRECHTLIWFLSLSATCLTWLQVASLVFTHGPEYAPPPQVWGSRHNLREGYPSLSSNDICGQQIRCFEGLPCVSQYV